jgi:prevent-host-death family protein
MMKNVTASQAKARLSELMAEVALQGQQVVIQRRGRPIAALVSMEDLNRLGSAPAQAARPAGALALVGAWAEVEDENLDAIVDEIYRCREKEHGRAVELET